MAIADMLTFSTLLSTADINRKGVRLVRHRDPKYNAVIYDDAIRRHPRFETYQSGQSNPRVIQIIRGAQVIAAFVVDRCGQTVFVGLWKVLGCTPGNVPDPYRSNEPAPVQTSVVFDLVRIPELDKYSGRVVIDWGGSERAWVQYADRRDKEIVELRPRAIEEPFPGFARFGCRLDQVAGLPESWVETLRSTHGVYLLLERGTGAQYVGSATGEDGLWGRWNSYANGHGGNVGLRELSLTSADYDVRILETAGSGLTREEVFAIETLWKNKLGSRVKGLNRNG